MTRTVADAALMMATLSLPDARDYASLPDESSTGPVEPAQLKGLRIGLLLEAGCGAPPTPEVRAAVERAARDFEAAGAHVEPLKPFLTRTCSTASTGSGAPARSATSRALPAERRALVLPFIRDWAESAAGFSGVEVFRGFEPDTGDAQGGRRRDRAVRRRAVADRADDRLSRRMAVADQRPAATVPANRLHRRLQHVRAAGGVGQLRLDGEGLPIGLQIIGAPVRRPRRARGRARLRGDAGHEARPWPEPPRPDRPAMPMLRKLGVIVGLEESA